MDFLGSAASYIKSGSEGAISASVSASIDYMAKERNEQKREEKVIIMMIMRKEEYIITMEMLLILGLIDQMEIIKVIIIKNILLFIIYSLI